MQTYSIVQDCFMPNQQFLIFDMLICYVEKFFEEILEMKR